MFLSPGEKILRYRKHYGINQEELTENKVSKTYLGMVELGKKTLSKKMGVIFYKNLQKIITSKGEEFNLTYNDFIETSEEQAKKYLNLIIENKNLENSWSIQEAILKLNTIEQKKYLGELAELFLEKSDLIEAKEMYSKLFQRVVNLKGYEDKFIKFMDLCIKNKDYQIILILFDKYREDIFTNYNLKKCENIHYLYLLSKYKLNKLDTLKIEVEEYLNILKSKEIKNKCLKILAELYSAVDFKKSIEIYFYLLKKVVTLEERLETLCTLGNMLKEKELESDLKNIYFKLKKIYEKKILQNDNQKFQLLYNLGKITESMGKKIESRTFYIEALIIGKGIEVPLNEVIDIIKRLFEMFEKSDYYSLLSIEKEYLRILKDYEDYKPVIKLFEYYYKNYPHKMDEKFNLFRNYLE